VATAKTPTRRLTAEQRREEILVAALPEFARGGLYGTSTEVIAERAGISQPYLFRLFGTKKELFLTCHRHCCEQVTEAFAEAAAQLPEGASSEERLHAMGAAYQQLLSDRVRLLMMMQGFAACEDPEIRAAVREQYARCFKVVEQGSGAPDEDLLRFFATGMLLNLSAAMGLRNASPGEPEAWAAAFKRGR
jgi:AcrR family transcriptional regulator